LASELPDVIQHHLLPIPEPEWLASLAVAILSPVPIPSTPELEHQAILLPLGHGRDHRAYELLRGIVLIAFGQIGPRFGSNDVDTDPLTFEDDLFLYDGIPSQSAPHLDQDEPDAIVLQVLEQFHESRPIRYLVLAGYPFLDVFPCHLDVRG